MIRYAGAIAFVLFLLVSFALYNGVHRVKSQLAEIKAIETDIEHEKESIRVLKAEWTHLVQPERLQALALRHLMLGPTSAVQIVPIDAVPIRGPRSTPEISVGEQGVSESRPVAPTVARDKPAAERARK